VDSDLLRHRLRATMRVAGPLLFCVALSGVAGCRGAVPPAAQPQLSIAGTTAALTAPDPTGSIAAPPAPPEVVQPTWQTIGMSVQGRPIRSMTVGHGPRRVLFVGGIHGDEAEGAYTTAQLPAAFAADGLADLVTLTIIEDANPDGRAAGTRGNANGVDVNRNFPATNFDSTNLSFGGQPLSQPESRTLFDAIERTNPELILVAHAWAGRKFINFDGPARDIAQRFSTASGLAVEDSTSFASTPGSLGSYVGRDRGTPILTIEVLKGTDPVAVWGQLKDAVLQAIRG
jgi:protein MpaA